ncbi:helix-turn-helix transcriptional regulator [Streptomyces sp. NPDC057654]|uniref:helix-turn-helix transcriptional regulator n=1 Tax=Streptomyces sp. NPDC057654 TaxID=3346196 RepID=UPI0036AC14B0
MQRQFDPERLRRIRRARGLKLSSLAHELGYAAHTTVSSWLKGAVSPPPEKLPAIARAFGENLDDLFPRLGEPDLRDLRCDAGLPLKALPKEIGTQSTVPVKNAERGVRRLDPAFVAPMAKAYRVSTEDLLAAQDRSFGEYTPPPVPLTVAQKLTRLLDSFPAASRPSDADIAAAVNAKAGADLLRPAQVKALRTETAPPRDILDRVPETVLYTALSEIFGVEPLFFWSEDELVHQVVELMNHLANHASVELHARGAVEGLSPQMLAGLNTLLRAARRSGPTP